MECQPSDSKKLFKVFDASKRKRTRKKQDDNNSLATDESTGGAQANGRRIPSGKQSLQDMPAENTDCEQDGLAKRDSSPESRSPGDVHRPSRSPRRRRHIAREGISLALKAGLVSTPRSISPPLEGENTIESVPRDQDSFIYAFLEEAIKRDKKKINMWGGNLRFAYNRHRHERRQDDHRIIRDRDASVTKERRHHHRKHREECRHREKHVKEEPPAIDQLALFETFAKLCAQMNDKTPHHEHANTVPRSQSHKSLQCEVVSRRDSYEMDHRPVRLQSCEQSREHSPSRIRSTEHFRGRVRSHDNIAVPLENRKDKCSCCPPYDKQQPRYTSKANLDSGKNHEERYRDYPLETTATRSFINGYYRSNAPERRDARDYTDRRDPRKIEDRRRVCEQKTSRSFDMHRENQIDEDRLYRRTTRSDGIQDKIYEDREYRDRKLDDRCYKNKYYEGRDRERMYANTQGRDQRTKKNLERLERSSIVSRDEEYNRDRYSERERDSGLSVADGETSTMSGKSNYLKVVKQEISEQREAMDKMMKLWKELMRCFKGISQTQGKDKAVNESAAAQLRLWRECMRRYETVARDVGDTDARLMEEINKQRSEMTEMASMWQECLQRYRDMSTDFNNLKQKLASQSPPRTAEGDLPPPAPLAAHPHYRLPRDYPPMPPIPPYAGTPLQSRASAPPAPHQAGPPTWWWGNEGPPMRDSHDSPDRDRRHRHRDRDDLRYKEKTAKPNGARSEHRRRKR